MAENCGSLPQILENPEIFKKIIKKKLFGRNRSNFNRNILSICLLTVESYRPVEFLEKKILESWRVQKPNMRNLFSDDFFFFFGRLVQDSYTLRDPNFFFIVYNLFKAFQGRFQNFHTPHSFFLMEPAEECPDAGPAEVCPD